ncbi:unnamed protein product [Moneuplotes crassus]|uniref:Uncharacterized protein n=1 Tax=Euplotes crassus TaxID=5936 RepID=A0AAD1XZE8_EUPCR|nr:unnamed protein product [Moneuplotes crassus]
MKKKGVLKRKKSVNFKDQPEILQTPPKSVMGDQEPKLKGVLKRDKPNDIKLLSTPAPPAVDNLDLSGSKTERFNEPKPLLPPFKPKEFKDTFKLNSKKPVRTLNIMESFNSSLKKANSHVNLPSVENKLKLPSIVNKRYHDNPNVQRIYIGQGNTVNNSLNNTRPKRGNIKISFKSNVLKKAQEKLRVQQDGSYSDPEKQTPSLHTNKSVDPEGFKSTFKNRTRNNGRNLPGGSLGNVQAESLNSQLGKMLSMDDTHKKKRSRFGNGALSSIQQKINKAILQSQEVQPREVPKDIPKVQEIKPAKIIPTIQVEEYKPAPEAPIERNPKIFSNNSYSVNQSLPVNKGYMKPQRNHLQPYESSNKFSIRYKRPTVQGMDEQVFSLGDSKPLEPESNILYETPNPEPQYEEKKDEISELLESIQPYIGARPIEEEKAPVIPELPVMQKAKTPVNVPKLNSNNILQSELFKKFEKQKATLEHYDNEKEDRKEKLRLASESKTPVQSIPYKREKTDKQLKIEELKKETEALEEKRKALNKRLKEKKLRYQQKAKERINELNTILSTKTKKEQQQTEYEDPYEFLETQSDNGDILSIQDDPFDIDGIIRGSNNNTNFNILQNKLISPFQKITDDTLIKDSLQMISKSAFVPALLRNSVDMNDIQKRNEIVQKVTKFDTMFSFTQRNNPKYNPINGVLDSISKKKKFFRQVRNVRRPLLM